MVDIVPIHDAESHAVGSQMSVMTATGQVDVQSLKFVYHTTKMHQKPKHLKEYR